MRAVGSSLLVLALLGMGCGPSGRPEDVEFHPSLEVDLASMQKSESGLYSRDWVVGEGPDVVSGDEVRAHYTLWFPDGRLVESSIGTNPIDFTVGVSGVIRGWHEGLLGMKAGGRRLLVIPSDLAYGSSGKDKVPPNMVLVFEVQLVEIL